MTTPGPQQSIMADIKRVTAATEALENAGATDVELSYRHDDGCVIGASASWTATCFHDGTLHGIGPCASPGAAVEELAAAILDGTPCPHCGQRIVMTAAAGPGDCPWRRHGAHWTPACQLPAGPGHWRLRLYLDGTLHRESWIEADADREASALAAEHRQVTDAAAAEGQRWLIEIWDPQAPTQEGYIRFGTDTGGMRAPVTFDDPRVPPMDLFTTPPRDGDHA